MSNLARQIAKILSVTDYLSYRDFLSALYEQCKKTDKKYSFLQLAEDLGFSATNVIWMVISERRKLTLTTTQKIADALELKGADRRYFFALVKYTNARLPEKREFLFQELLRHKVIKEPVPNQSLEYYSEWYHPVLREMVALPDFKADPTWIAKRIHAKLLPQQIRDSLKLLSNLGLIEFVPATGKYKQVAGDVLPNRSVETMAFIRYHQKMLEMARDALTRIPAADRDMNVITACLTKKQAEIIKAKLHGLCAEILEMEKSNASPGNDIFQVSTQIFPVTKTTHTVPKEKDENAK